jgi:hypothetical protein
MALGTQDMARSIESQPQIITEAPPMLPSLTNMALGTQDMTRSIESQSQIIAEAPPMLPALTTRDKHSPVTVDMALWTDKERLKRELVAWAKAVAAMAVHASSAQGSTNR